MSQIYNAAPMTILRGTQDLSTRTVPQEAEVLPTHLPKVYIYAQKGPTTPELVVGNSRTQMYGADSFDERSIWATHQTVLSNKINAEGNAQMIERILPADIGPRANFTLWLDVLETAVTVYQRNQDGTFVLDETGAKVAAVPAATVPGYKIKWVLTSETTKANESKFGTKPRLLAIKPTVPINPFVTPSHNGGLAPTAPSITCRVSVCRPRLKTRRLRSMKQS